MLMPLIGPQPHLIHSSTPIAPAATVIGGVTLGAHVSMGFGTSLRGHVNTIEVGVSSGVQDNAVLHTISGANCSVGAVMSEGIPSMVVRALREVGNSTNEHGAVKNQKQIRDFQRSFEGLI